MPHTQFWWANPLTPLVYITIMKVKINERITVPFTKHKPSVLCALGNALRRSPSWESEKPFPKIISIAVINTKVKYVMFWNNCLVNRKWERVKEGGGLDGVWKSAGAGRRSSASTGCTTPGKVTTTAVPPRDDNYSHGARGRLCS